MNPVNPKWERTFMLSMLNLKTLEMQLQEEWNNKQTPAAGGAAQVRDQNIGGSDVRDDNTKKKMPPMQGDKAAY
jgi:hypothetical protein